MEKKMFNPAQEMSSIAFDKILGGALAAVVEAQNNSSLTTVNFIKNVGFENDQNGNTIKPVYVDFKYPKEVSPYIPARPESYYFTVENGGEGYDQDELNAGAYTVDGKNEIKLAFIVNTEGAITAVNVVEGEAKLTASSKLDITGSGDGASIVLSKNEAVPAVPAVYEDMTLQVPLLTIVPIPFIRVATTDIDMNVKINSIYNTDTSTDTKSTVDTKTNANYGFLFAKGSININASVAHQKKTTEKEEVKKEYSLNIKIHAVQVDIDTVQMNEYATRDCLMHIKLKVKEQDLSLMVEEDAKGKERRCIEEVQAVVKEFIQKNEKVFDECVSACRQVAAQFASYGQKTDADGVIAAMRSTEQLKPYYAQLVGMVGVFNLRAVMQYVLPQTGS